MSVDIIAVAYGILIAAVCFALLLLCSIASEWTRWPDSVLVWLIRLSLPGSRMSPAWSDELNALLDEHPVESDQSTRTVRVGPAVVWARNWPYAYGSRWGAPMPRENQLPGDGDGRGLPDAATRVRLLRAVERARLQRDRKP